MITDNRFLYWAGDILGETGIVVDVIDNNVKVSMVRTEACAKCRACTVGMAKQEMLIVARNICEAKTGDKVIVELNGGSFLSATLIMYGIPLIMLLLGFFLGYYVTGNIGIQNNEILSFVTGMCFLLISYIFISKKESSFKNRKYEPIAAEIVE